MLLLGPFVKFLEGRSILGLPLREPVCAPSMNDGSGSARAGELRVLGEGVVVALLHKRPVGHKLLAKDNDERVTLLR